LKCVVIVLLQKSYKCCKQIQPGDWVWNDPNLHTLFALN
jgi:hypothetical protein